MLLIHHRHIGPHILLPGLSTHHRQVVVYLERIVDRVFGDDIDGSAHGIGPKKGRSSSAHHLYPLYHRHGYLLQTIHSRQGTHHRTAVDEYLRIGTFQSVDAHLRKTAVLTVVLYPQSRLIIERFGQVGGIDSFKQLGAKHVHHHGGITLSHLIAVGSHHHLIKHKRILIHRPCCHHRAHCQCPCSCSRSLSTYVSHLSYFFIVAVSYTLEYKSPAKAHSTTVMTVLSLIGCKIR